MSAKRAGADEESRMSVRDAQRCRYSNAAARFFAHGKFR